MRPVKPGRRISPGAKAQQKPSRFKASAKAIIASRQALIRAEAAKAQGEKDKALRKQQRLASLHGLIFPDNIFHSWHVQDSMLQWLSLRQNPKQEFAVDDGIPKKTLDDLRGMERFFGVRDAAAKNLPAEEYWNQYVKKITSFHQDDEKLLRLLMDEDPDFEDHISELSEEESAPRYLWISPHAISDYIRNYFADANWLELRASASVSSPQSSDRGKSPKKPKAMFPSGDTVQSIEAIKTDERSASVVFLDICSMENTVAPQLDPRGAGLSTVPDYGHLGLTCSGTSSASTLLFLSRSLRTVLKILKEDGYLIILWGAFVGHPMIFFIKTMLEPLFVVTTVLAAPSGSFETVLFFRGFSIYDTSSNINRQAPGPQKTLVEYETLSSFLGCVQREEGIDDILAWTLPEKDMKEEFDKNGEEWFDVMNTISSHQMNAYYDKNRSCERAERERSCCRSEERSKQKDEKQKKTDDPYQKEVDTPSGGPRIRSFPMYVNFRSQKRNGRNITVIAIVGRFLFP